MADEDRTFSPSQTGASRTRERTRLTLQMTKAALEAERALMIFPAGRLARRIDGVLTDKPWAASALSIARKYEAPVIPLHVTGPWATLFHLFDRVSGELRDITLFHELLNKKGGRFSLIVGEPLDPAAIESIEALKHYVYRTAHAELLRDRRSWFEQFSGAMLAMWWVPAGHIPSVEEAKERLAHLEQHGPSAYAFTFRTLHEPAAGVQHAVSGG